MMAEQETQQDGDLTLFNKLLQCVICFEPYANPKKLQCGHIFCEECLQCYYKFSQQKHNAQPGKLPCPTCQGLTSIPENGISGLRNDFKAHKLEEAFQMMTVKCGSSHLCNPCKSKKMTVDASVYCSKCKVNYCNGCLLKHNKNPIFKDHKVFEKSAQENLTITEFTCKVHRGEDGRYFCQTCKVVVCTLCIIDKHSEHVVGEVDELYMQQQQDKRNLGQIIDSKVKRQRNVKAVLEDKRKQIVDSRKKVENAIEEKVSQMIANIQKQEAEQLREVRQNSDQHLKPLEKELEMVNFYITQANILQEYTRSSGKDSLIQMMAINDELIQRMHTIAEADESTYNDNDSLDSMFLAEQEVVFQEADVLAAAVSPAASRNVVSVNGIDDATDEDPFKVFLECNGRSGGGSMDTGEEVVAYLNEGDAESVLQHGDMSLEGGDLTIARQDFEETAQNEEYVAVPSCATTKTQFHVLEIRGIKPHTPRKRVEKFIKIKSEESELQSLRYTSKTGVTVVAFKDTQDATKMMSLDKLEFEGARLSVTPLRDSYDGLDRESCRPRAIQVKGISKGVSKEFLELVFENRRTSDGGEIELIDYDDEEGIAVIIFNDADTVSRVVQKEPLIVNNTPVQVKLMTPPTYMRDVPGPFEENLFLVSGLSPMCTGDDVKTFFSASNIQSEIQCVTFSLKPGVAMLQFTHPPEFHRLRELCVTKPLWGTMLSVQRVPQSQAIQVHNIGDVTEEILKLYFENRRSGGCEVTNVHVCQQHGHALVEFAECAIIRDILAKENHNVLNQALHVTTYLECFGLIPPQHDTKVPAGLIPKNVRVTGLCPRVLNFLQTSVVSREMVDTEMAQVAAVVEWGTYTYNSIELMCTISHKMTNAQAMAKMWNQTASKTFLDVFTKNFVSVQTETLQEAWKPFMGCTIYLNEIDPSKICVDVSDDACSVCITGLRKEVDDISAKLKDDHSKVQEEMTRAATIVAETKSGFKLHHLRMLNAMQFKSQQQKKYTDLTVVIDMEYREVKFTGMPGDITLAKLEMYEILNNVTEKFIEISASLISLLHGKDMMKHVVGQFRDRNICAVYNDAGRNKLGVYALSDEHLNAAIEVINATTSETSVEADVDKMSAPEKLTELIDAQQSQHGGLLTIAVSGNTVDLAGAKSRVEVALVEIQKFLKDYVINMISSVTLPGGATVAVIQGDLTKFQADAIVNAANGRLEHKGELAKAIAHAGGPEIQLECRDHVRHSGNIEDGSVYVSTPGRLPCKKVIHAVYPGRKGRRINEADNLHNAVYESMLAAEQCNLSSIAFPALSSGGFDFPTDKSTKTIITALTDFLEFHTESCVKRVSLLDPREDIVRAFHKSLCTEVGSLDEQDSS